MISVRAILTPFLGAFAWLVWTVEHQTESACYRDSHYVPSAAIGLVLIVTLVVVSHRPWVHGSARYLLREGVVTAMLSAACLAAAGFFAAVASCSG